MRWHCQIPPDNTTPPDNHSVWQTLNPPDSNNPLYTNPNMPMMLIQLSNRTFPPDMILDMNWLIQSYLHNNPH